MKRHRFFLWLLTLLVSSLSLSAQQQYTLKGTVEDSMNEPLVGVSVVVNGSSNGVMTDLDGNFSIQVKNGDTVNFSYIGFINQQVKVSGQNNITIVLQESAENLNELVVIGYGTARKKDLTGAVVQISPEKLADQNPGTVQDLLRGTPGLQIGYNPDAKGSASIQLRGQNSLYTSGNHNSPLIILDGMQFNGELSEINPDDIEAIDVLKDASSAAIYGAKAASGVIIITTKKGKSGKPVVTVSANLAINTKSAFREVFGPDEYLKYREDYYKTPTAGVRADGTYGYYSVDSKVPDGYFDFYGNVQSMYGITPEQWANSGTIQIGEKGTMDEVYASRLLLNQASNVYANFLNGRKTVDWYDLTFRTGFNQDYNGSVSGATENVNYYFSVGYLKNEGAIRGNDYHSMRASMKINANITPWLEIGANANFQDRSDGDIQVSIGSNYWDANMLRNSPFASYRKEDGSLEQYPFNGNPTNGGYNYDFDRQYLDLEKGYTTLNTIFNAQVKLPFNIVYRFNIAPRFQWHYDRYFMSAELPDSNPVNRGVNRKSAKSFDWNLNNTLTWDYYFNKIHHVTVMVGQEAEENRYWSDNIEARHITPTDALGLHYISGANKSESSFWSTDTHITAASYFGRVFYGFNDRYMVTATVRRDGYSAFGANDPWANFWSVGASWRINEEKFMDNTRDWLSDLKFRVSYGTNGNRSLQDTYSSLSNLSDGGVMVYMKPDGSPVVMESLAVSRLGNPNLSWEKTGSFNVGLDFGFLQGRIGGSIDYYSKSTKDMIMWQRLPSFSGFGNIITNLGEVTNKGVEISLRAVPYTSQNFEWSTNVGFSYNKNRIKHIYNDYDPETGKENNDLSNGWFIDKPIGEIWNYKLLGIWQVDEAEEAAKFNQKPGDPKVWNNPANDKVDDKGNVVIVYDNDDKVFQGTTAPPIYWNWRNDFTIMKDLTFSFSMYSYMGHKSADWTYLNSDNGGSWVTNTGNVWKKEYWMVENPTNEYARLEAQGPLSGTDYAAPKILNRNFVRIDNVALGYTIPQKWTRQFYIERLRVSAAINNLCTIHAGSWKFGDPESGGNGLGVRTYTFGLSVTL